MFISAHPPASCVHMNMYSTHSAIRARTYDNQLMIMHCTCVLRGTVRWLMLVHVDHFARVVSGSILPPAVWRRPDEPDTRRNDKDNVGNGLSRRLMQV